MNQDDKFPVRVIGVQGPLQLLSALSVLFYLEETKKQCGCRDYLVLYGMASADIRQAVLDIAAIWRWEKIVLLDDFERDLTAGKFADWDALRIKLLEFIPVDPFDNGILLAARNWQMVNRVLLTVFKEFYKITYGDGLGVIDSYSSSRYIQFDEACLLLPHRLTPATGRQPVSFKNLPLTVVPKHFFLKVIDTYFSKGGEAKAYFSRVAGDSRGKILVLTENIYGCGDLDFEDEMNIYIDSLLSVVKPGDSVMIKPHPRESTNMCGGIAEVLEKRHSIPTEVFGENRFFQSLPVEVVVRAVPFKKIIAPLNSIARYSLKFLYNLDCEAPLFIEHLEKIKPRRRNYYHRFFTLVNSVIQRCVSWDGKSVLFEPDHDTQISTKQIESPTDSPASIMQTFNEGMYSYLLGDETIACRDFAAVIKSNHSEVTEQRIRSFFFLGDIHRKQGADDWKQFYKSGLELLIQKKNKKPHELYRVASLYKRMEDYDNATHWFNTLVASTSKTDLLPGVYFHLGEIHLQIDKTEKAIQYFEKCLEMNPSHQKATQYLQNVSSPYRGSKGGPPLALPA